MFTHHNTHVANTGCNTPPSVGGGEGTHGDSRPSNSAMKNRTAQDKESRLRGSVTAINRDRMNPGLASN